MSATEVITSALAVNFGANDGQVTAQHGEDVVEVVRNSTGQRAERIELLCLALLRLEPAVLGDISDDPDEPNRQRPLCHTR